jgi:hypothetical protein
MKRRWIWSCTVAAVLLATALSSAQQHGNNSSSTLAFENGTIVNGVYSNECFGFSLPIPAGWVINDTVTPGGEAIHSPSKKDLILLFLEREDKTPGRIILSAWDSASHSGNVQDFVSEERPHGDRKKRTGSKYFCRRLRLETFFSFEPEVICSRQHYLVLRKNLHRVSRLLYRSEFFIDIARGIGRSCQIPSENFVSGRSSQR